MISADDLAHSISLAVAPVFLLAGIAGFLNVMSGRLGRIIDRARVVGAQVSRLQDPEQQEITRRELPILWRRVSLTHQSIALCTCSALLVCAVVVGLFVGVFWVLNISTLLVALFVLAMVLLIFSLLLFLTEIQLATRTLRMGQEANIDND